MKECCPSAFEMDRKIRELEHAITENDEYLQRLEALNAELLAALKAMLGAAAVNGIDMDDARNREAISCAVEVIAKAEAIK